MTPSPAGPKDRGREVGKHRLGKARGRSEGALLQLSCRTVLPHLSPCCSLLPSRHPQARQSEGRGGPHSGRGRLVGNPGAFPLGTRRSCKNQMGNKEQMGNELPWG